MINKDLINETEVLDFISYISEKPKEVNGNDLRLAIFIFTEKKEYNKNEVANYFNWKLPNVYASFRKINNQIKNYLEEKYKI